MDVIIALICTIALIFLLVFDGILKNLLFITLFIGCLLILIGSFTLNKTENGELALTKFGQRLFDTGIGIVSTIGIVLIFTDIGSI